MSSSVAYPAMSMAMVKGVCSRRAAMLSPTELIEKLAALVPPPRRNLIRYHGVLAPAAADRAQIVPGPSALTAVELGGDHGHGDQSTVGELRHRVEWAKLLRRVPQVDVAKCDACGGEGEFAAG